jgi:hypothetical protein
VPLPLPGAPKRRKVWYLITEIAYTAKGIGPASSVIPREIACQAVALREGWRDALE